VSNEGYLLEYYFGSSVAVEKLQREGGGAVQRRRLELPTSCICEAGGALRWQLELPTSWHKGGGAVRLEGEANLPERSQVCLFTSFKCLLTMTDLMSQKIATCNIDGVNLTKEFSNLASNIRCKLKCIHNRINNI
jgi:hypothetical protein